MTNPRLTITHAYVPVRTALPFVIVAALVLLLALVGWRSIAAGVARRRRRRRT